MKNSPKSNHQLTWILNYLMGFVLKQYQTGSPLRRVMMGAPVGTRP
jgi:hypothetical protein